MNNNKQQGPVSPIYAILLLWIAWTVILPLYNVSHILPLLMLSALVYGSVNKAAKQKQAEKEEKAKARREEAAKKREEEKNKPKSPEIAALMKKRDESIGEMRRLNREIEDRRITAQINDMEYTTSQIFEYVINHPEKEKDISKFLNYYLPTTIKLLNTYDSMVDRGVKGENITQTMKKVEQTLDMVVDAFHKQLDTLFAGDALDVSSDIMVMENLMKQEGLQDDGLASEIKLSL